MRKFSVAALLMTLSITSFGDEIESCSVASESLGRGRCIDLEIITPPELDVVSNSKFVGSVERSIQDHGYILEKTSTTSTDKKAHVKLALDNFQLSQDLPSGKITGTCSSSAEVKIEDQYFFATPTDYRDTSSVDVTQEKGISIFKQRLSINCGKKAANAILTILTKELPN